MRKEKIELVKKSIKDKALIDFFTNRDSSFGIRKIQTQYLIWYEFVFFINRLILSNFEMRKFLIFKLKNFIIKKV